VSVVGAETASVGQPRIIATVLVAAVADNGIIGRTGGLPWRLKSDMRHFRALTLGKPVVMGRKTFLSIGKPLSERTNIVVSRDRTLTVAGAVVVSSLEAALAIARADALRRNADAIMVIGGGDIYAQALARADRLEITRIHAQPAGDAQFPSISSTTWEVVSCVEHGPGPGDDASFTFLTYMRANNALYEGMRRGAR
jgi:dihydrofolate reductase